MPDYIPNTSGERQAMLEAMGLTDIEDLLGDLPAAVRQQQPTDLPPALAELELDRHLRQLAGNNRSLDELVCFLGAGAYDHYIPAIVPQLAGRQEFYTAYTPYQPEISQGTLQAIFEYQTMICELTGLDVTNASMYDGATALAEAVDIACATTGRRRLLVASTLNPQYRRVLDTFAPFGEQDIVSLPADRQTGRIDLAALDAALCGDSDSTASADSSRELPAGTAPIPAQEPCGTVSIPAQEPAGTAPIPAQAPASFAAVVVQNPNFYGSAEELRPIAESAHRAGALLIVSLNPIAAALLTSPGEAGADLACGDGQPLGNTLSFGGPSFGFLTARQELLRRLPGRIVGQTADAVGRRGFVLTLQTREQHIRREKATSNICTNQALNALCATIYLARAGKTGLREVAWQAVQKAHYLRDRLLAITGFEPYYTGEYVYEFALRCPPELPPDSLNAALLRRGYLGGLALPERGWLLAVTEKRSRAELDGFADAVASICRGEDTEAVASICGKEDADA